MGSLKFSCVDETYNKEEFKGHFFIDNVLYQGKGALGYIREINIEDIGSELLRLNGFFAFVVNNDEYFLAAVDRVRTIPLFYYYKDDEFYISYSPYTILKDMNLVEIGIDEEEEFLSCGFVNGESTLIKGLKQLRAGEYLVFNKSNNELIINRYFNYDKCIETQDVDMKKKMLEVFDSATKRILGVIGERTIYLPLSSGLDSRLIAMMLKKHGAKKVKAYSYGKVGNYESNISREISRMLGFEWLFVEYTDEKWREIYESDWYKDFMKAAHGLVSTPHLQDLPAIYEMSKEGLIEEDAVFLPGHTGDFLAGSFIPSGFYEESKKINIDDVVKPLLDRHYSFRGHYSKNHRLYKLFKGRIINEFKNVFKEDINGGVDLTEKWVWQERQAKFITNSLRTYEFFGYAWTMLFWDSEVIDLFLSLKLEDRYNKKVYTEFVEELTDEYLKNTIEKKDITYNKNGKYIREVLNELGLINIVRKLNAFKRKRNYVKEYKYQPLKMYGIMSQDEFKNRYNGWQGINSFIAEDTLESTKKYLKELGER